MTALTQRDQHLETIEHEGWCGWKWTSGYDAQRQAEQDYRGVKRITRPMLGFKSFEAAQSTLTGIELIRMLRKDQGLRVAEQFYALGSSSPGRLGFHHLRSSRHR